MATVEKSEAALHTLADRLAERNAAEGRRSTFDRSLSCSLPDLDVIFTGRLSDGDLVDIARSRNADAQIRLEVSSDDLVLLVDGGLSAASAFATGRLKVRAGVRDMMRLRSIF